MTEPIAVPSCYRHADQPTHIRCARCERPICAQCMIPAPVGFQCPECVGAAARQQPSVRTPFGGQVIDKPRVTYALIAINVVVFGLQYLIGINEVSGNYGMWPAGIALGGEWYRLLTAAFLHGSILHILFNMYVLYALGPTLERVLGHARFLLLYVLAALGGSVASYAFSDVRTLSVGASGAIFGLMGALVVAGRRLRYDVTQVLILLGVNVVIGFLAPGVDWRAHLGGLVTGAAVAAIMAHAPKKGRSAWQAVGVGAVIIALLVVAIWRTQEIQALFGPVGFPA